MARIADVEIERLKAEVSLSGWSPSPPLAAISFPRTIFLILACVSVFLDQFMKIS